MSERIYNPDGTLQQAWDDATRTYTDYRTNPPTTRPYTDTENAQADADALAAATMTDQQWHEALRDWYISQHTTTDPDADNIPDWTPSGAYGPGAIVAYNGHTWVNNTTATLNGHYIPGDPEHPFWTQRTDGQTPTPWAAGMPLTTGQLVSTDDGHVWRYIGDPVDSAPANWKPTTANATWEAVS